MNELTYGSFLFGNVGLARVGFLLCLLDPHFLQILLQNVRESILVCDLPDENEHPDHQVIAGCDSITR